MTVKGRFKLYLGYVLVGILVLVFSYSGIFSASLRRYTESFGAVLVLIGGIKAWRFRRIASNEDDAREFEARQTEERSVFITLRATRWVFYGSVFLQMAASLVFSYLGQSVAAQTLCYLTALQCAAYAVIWKILDKKY